VDITNPKLSALLGNRHVKTVKSRSATLGEAKEVDTVYGVRTLSDLSRKIEEKRPAPQSARRPALSK
jgi:hypothetical protein